MTAHWCGLVWVCILAASTSAALHERDEESLVCVPRRLMLAASQDVGFERRQFAKVLETCLVSNKTWAWCRRGVAGMDPGPPDAGGQPRRRLWAHAAQRPLQGRPLPGAAVRRGRCAPLGRHLPGKQLQQGASPVVKQPRLKSSWGGCQRRPLRNTRSPSTRCCQDDLRDQSESSIQPLFHVYQKL